MTLALDLPEALHAWLEAQAEGRGASLQEEIVLRLVWSELPEGFYEGS